MEHQHPQPVIPTCKLKSYCVLSDNSLTAGRCCGCSDCAKIDWDMPAAKEKALLRGEVAIRWKMTDVIMDAWTVQASVFIDRIRLLEKTVSDYKGTIDEKDMIIKDLKRRLAIHENCNNPDRSTITANNRKKHRKKLKEREAKEAESKEAESKGGEDSKTPDEKSSTILKKRGGQPGSKGKSLKIKPDPDLAQEYDAPKMCGLCGRTDLRHLKPIYKIVIDERQCGGVSVYMEKSTPAMSVVGK